MRRPSLIALWVLSIALVGGAVLVLWWTGGGVPPTALGSVVICDSVTAVCATPPDLVFGSIVYNLAPLAFGCGLVGVLAGLVLGALSKPVQDDEGALPDRDRDHENHRSMPDAPRADEYQSFMPPAS